MDPIYYIWFLIIFGFILSYTTRSYQSRMAEMLIWLISQHNTLFHEEFQDEYIDFEKSIDNIYKWTTDTYHKLIPLIIIHGLTLYLLFDQETRENPFVLVALTVGYVVWSLHLLKIRERRFLTEGLCLAALNLKTAIIIYEKTKNEADAVQQDDSQHSTN